MDKKFLENLYLNVAIVHRRRAAYPQNRACWSAGHYGIVRGSSCLVCIHIIGIYFANHGDAHDVLNLCKKPQTEV